MIDGIVIDTRSAHVICAEKVIEFAECYYTVMIPVFSLSAWKLARQLTRDVTAERMTAYRRAGFDIRQGLPRTEFEAGEEDL